MPRCQAEWDKATDILVHAPGDELFFGVIHPAAALFERTFSTDGATREHLSYQQQLREQGIRVHTLSGALLRGTCDKNGEVIEGEPLERLRRLARKCVSVRCEGFPDLAAEQNVQEEYLLATIEQLHPRDLVRILLLNPVMTLRSTARLNTGYSATYEVRPLMNLYFLRDQAITTARGIVIGRMNSIQRRDETEIVRLALENLGIQPIAVVHDPGRMEGGDFLPAGTRAFIASGLRTNQHAIEQLLEGNVFGVGEVVVVQDRWKHQEQMHLDTYFNLISPTLCVLAENRLNAEAGSPQRLEASIYRRQEEKFQLVREKVDFAEYLANDLGMGVMAVRQKDQARYGVNFLTIGINHIFLSEGVSNGYLESLRQQGVHVELVDFSNLQGGYGACHCTVQVLSRKGDPVSP